MSTLFLGDTDRQGNADAQAWKLFGYNLDGRISTATATDLCKVVVGANPAMVRTDGPGGIDNSWGANIMPMVIGLASDTSQVVNVSIHSGSGTWLFDAGAIGIAPDYLGVKATEYAAGPLGTTPAWNGYDLWPVRYESVVGGNIAMPKSHFAQSYVTHRTWVAQEADVPLTLSVEGFMTGVTIHHAIVTGALASDNSSLQQGVLAGVLSTAEVIASLHANAGKISPSLCSPSTLASIAQQVAQASDIMLDGTQDPTATCNGISIGLGFEARAALMGSVLAPQAPTGDGCTVADAGTDAGPDSGASGANLGSHCNSDADCAGLHCETSTGTSYLGGGPANGYCTVDCTAAANGVGTDPCPAMGGTCVNVSATSSVVAWCLKNCTLGPSSATTFSPAKCHARHDSACQQLTDVNGNPGDTVCVPACASDSDCPFGRHCDPRSAACVAVPSTGDPLGTHCSSDPDAAPTCAGTCLTLTGTGSGYEYSCSTPCVLGTTNSCDFSLGAGLDAGGGGPMGYCLFAVSTAGVGDQGYCGQLCDTAADCLDIADAVGCDTSTVSSLGHGYCY